MPTEYIIELLRKGDVRAFQVIYDEFYIRLCYMANRIIENECEAEDITMSALESIFEKPLNFNSYEKLKAYLFLRVKNKCISYLGHIKSHRNLHTEILHLSANNYQDFVEAQIIRSEFLNLIYEEIKNLPPVRRKVFEMLYIDGLSPDEVGAALNMTRDAVYVNKSKAIRDLRIILFDELVK